MTHSIEYLLIILSLLNRQDHGRRISSACVNTLGRFLKIGGGSDLVVRHELLRISGDERKPRALDLYHYPMAFFERMRNPRHRERKFCRRIRRQGRTLFKPVPKSCRHGFTSKQHLITAGRKHAPRRVLWWSLAVGVAKIVREHIDQLNDKIRI